jgi:hypothetical protein
MASKKTWQGTASELLPLLTPLIPEQAARERGWPKRAADLGGKLRRVAPALRRTGIHVTFRRAGHGGPRTVQIEKRVEAGPEQGRQTLSPLSPPSPAGCNTSKINGLGANRGDSGATAGDSTATALSAGAVTANPLRNHAGDSGDGGDSVLPHSPGNGLVNDVDAVFAELAARHDED